MTADEGVIKFHCDWEPSPPLPDADIAALEQWRVRLFSAGLIGYDVAAQVGFGNLSQRLANGSIIITGSQTGHLGRLSGAHYVCIVGADIDANRVIARGPVQPSSETLTHIAIYALDPQISAVFHVHDQHHWQQLCGVLPTTAADVAYGTPAMAREFQRLYRETQFADKGVAAMAGHPDGLVSFGRDLLEAGRRLLDVVGQ